MSRPINYNYSVIEECVSMMQNANGKISGEIEELKNQVAGLLDDSWAGRTAEEGYKIKAGELQLELTTKNEDLNTMRATLRDGAQSMQDTDRNGVGRFQ